MTKKKSEVQLPLFNASTLMYFDPNIDSLLVPTLERAINRATSHIRTAAFHPSTIFSQLLTEKQSSNHPKSTRQFQDLTVASIPITVAPVRMLAFCNNNKCVSCGIEGNVFLSERHVNEQEDRQSLNLYSVTNTGTVMLTVDHILPEAFGGRFHIDNLQVMCQPCNCKKADKLSNAEIVLLLQNIPKHVKSWVDHEFITWLLKLYMAKNSESDKARCHLLNATMSRYRKRISHSTKAAAYAEMSKHIKALLEPPKQDKWSIRQWLATIYQHMRNFRPVVKNTVSG